MRTSLYVLCAVTAVGCALRPARIAAQSIPSPYTYLEERQEIGLLFGYMNVANGRFNYGPKGGNLFGVRYGIELSGPLSFEGVIQYIDGTRWVVDPGREQGDRIIGEAPADITTIEARLKFTATGRRAWNGIAPFLAFGGGMALASSGEAELDGVLLADDRFDYGTSFFGTVSGGVRWYLTDRFTLRGDGVFSLWKIDTPPGYADPDRDFQDVGGGEWLLGRAVTVSLLWRW
jgi:hypothetical protein